MRRLTAMALFSRAAGSRGIPATHVLCGNSFLRGLIGRRGPISDKRKLTFKEINSVGGSLSISSISKMPKWQVLGVRRRGVLRNAVLARPAAIAGGSANAEKVLAAHQTP